MPRYLFVRHGESVANAEGWLSGHIDTPLTELGAQQARRVSHDIREMSFERVWCSDLSRARRTLELMLDGRSSRPVFTRSLRERRLGAFQRRMKAELRGSRAMDELLTWRGCPAGSESQRDLARRVVGWFATQPSAAGGTLVVAHGGVIRVTLGLLDELPFDQIGVQRIPNATPIERDVPEGRWAELTRRLG